MGQIVGNVMSVAGGRAQWTQDKAAVYAQRTLQSANNRLEAAKSSTAYTLQSLANNRRLEAGGAEWSAAVTNTMRWLDSYTQGNLQQQVAAAEEMGAFSVGAAAAGQGGGSVAAIKRAMNLRWDMQQSQRDVQAGQVRSDGVEGAANAMKNAIMGLSNDQFFARLDYSVFLDPVKPASLGEVAMRALGGNPFAFDIEAGRQNMVRAAHQGNVQGGMAQFGQQIGQTIQQVASVMMPAMGLGGAAGVGAALSAPQTTPTHYNPSTSSIRIA